MLGVGVCVLVVVPVVGAIERPDLKVPYWPSELPALNPWLASVPSSAGARRLEFSSAAATVTAPPSA